MSDLEYFMSLQSGNEAIAFRPNSALMKDMTAAFQLGIDFRKSIEIPNAYRNADEKVRRNWLVTQVCQYVVKEVIPKFIDAVAKNTNVWIQKVYCNTNTKIGPCGMYAIDLSMGYPEAYGYTHLRTMGIANIKPARKSKLTQAIQDFMTLSENLDLESGSLKDITYGQNKDKKIFAKIYFDVIASFCMQDYVNLTENEPLTAVEIAAIMCHEIGHLLSMVERAGDAYFQHRRVVAHLNNLKNTTGIEELIDTVIPETLELLDQFKSSILVADDKLLKAKLDTYTACLSNIKGYIDKTYGNSGWSAIPAAIVQFIYPIVKLCWFLFSGTMLLSAFVYSLGKFIPDLLRDLSQEKTSDTITTLHNFRFCERLADEFVSRHNAGAAVASGLKKLIPAMEQTIFGLDSCATLRNSILVSKYLRFMVSILKWLHISSWTNNTYENLYDRMTRLAQNAVQPLKQVDLDPELRNQLLAEYKDIMTTAEEVKGVRDTKLAKAIGHLFEVFLEPAEIVHILGNGNIHRDYALLADQIDALMNSRLYVQSHQLLTLLKA